MELDRRLALLEEVYRIYDNFIAEFDWYCRPRCAVCCTRNVTVTTLEAALMVRGLMGCGLIECELNTGADKAWIGRIHNAAEQPRFQPLITINELADLCARDAELPEEEILAETLPCPLLEDNLCTAYTVRPFGCRALVSGVDCAQSGEAIMPPVVLSANNLFMQFIEALDVGRFYGNLIDVLQLLAHPLEYQAYSRGQPLRVPQSLRVNRPLSVLMLPPEDRSRLEPIIDALKKAAQSYS